MSRHNIKDHLVVLNSPPCQPAARPPRPAGFVRGPALATAMHRREEPQDGAGGDVGPLCVLGSSGASYRAAGASASLDDCCAAGPNCRQVQSLYSASEVSCLICIRSAWSAPTTQRNLPVSLFTDARIASATSSGVASSTAKSERKNAIRWFT